MFFSNHSNKEIISVLAADYHECRDGRHLLVWNRIPHWMVVDDEFYGFLSLCDGTHTFEELLARHSQWRQYRKSIWSQLKHLNFIGIINLSEQGAVRHQVSSHRSFQIENIAVNLTRRCNLRCAFCYNRFMRPDFQGQELSADEILGFLRSTRSHLSKNPSLILLGGEPLECTEKLLAVSKKARRLGFIPLVSTNGTQITDEFARQARKLRLEVQVSLDGHTPHMNDRVRGADAFDRALEGIRILKRHGVHTIMSMVCHRDNFSYLEDYYRLAETLKVDEARFIPLKVMSEEQDSSIKPVGTYEMITEAVRIFNRRPEWRHLLGRDCFSIVANTCRYSFKRPSCGTGLQTLLLDADGSLYPCLNMNRSEFKIADILGKDFNFDAIWKTSPILTALRKDSSVENPEHPCCDCIVKYWCLGGCRGETYAHTQKITCRSVHCRDFRRSILEMFWILADNSQWIKPMKKIC